MKFVFTLILISFVSFAQIIDETTSNDFFDNSPITNLKVEKLIVEGETNLNGEVNFSNLQLRKLTVKEALLNADNKPEFIGAYTYYGYSIFDILNKRLVNKKNKKTFSPDVDLYVTIENNKGEKVSLSWGEIFFPTKLHRNMIAVKVSCVLPSKTKISGPVPTDMKLVCGNDMFTHRNISNPVKITVKSYDKTFPGKKGLSPIFSEDITLLINNIETKKIKAIPTGCKEVVYPYVFFGRGRGFHRIEDFKGYLLKDFLKKHIKFTKENLMKSLLVFAAKDAYRCVYTFAEIFNRNDQSEFLLFDKGRDKNRGRYSIFPTPDFYSDRALRSINTLHLNLNP